MIRQERKMKTRKDVSKVSKFVHFQMYLCVVIENIVSVKNQYYKTCKLYVSP